MWMLVAGTVGFAVGAAWSPRSVERGEVEAVVIPAGSVERVPDEVALLARAPAPATSAPPAGLPASPLEQLRQVAQLKEQGLVAAVSVPMFLQIPGQPPRLTEQFKRYFGLNREEVDRLEAAMVRASAEARAMELRYAQPGQPGEGEEEGAWVVTIPAFPEEGGRAFDALYGEFAMVLGSERLGLFEKLMPQQLDQLGGHFGARERRIVIRPSEKRAGYYEYKDYFEINQGRGWHSGESDRANLELHFGELTRMLVPPGD
jgi:hypothetical protein